MRLAILAPPTLLVGVYAAVLAFWGAVQLQRAAVDRVFDFDTQPSLRIERAA